MTMPLPTDHPVFHYLDESSSTFFLILDDELAIRYANKHARALLNADPTGLPFAGCVVNFTAPDQLHLLIREGSAPIALDVAMGTGLPHSLVFRFYPYQGDILCFGERAGQDEDRFRTVMVDTTNELGNLARQLHKANAMLARASEEKNFLLGMVAHDLKGSIGGIFNVSELLLESDLDEDAESFVSLIHTHSKRLSLLLKDMLDVAAIESGKLILRPVPTPPEDLLNNTIAIHRRELLSKDVTIELRIQEPIPVISMDPLKMQQVMDNLLSNALKFSPIGSSITLEARADPEHVFLAVQDRGAGMDKEGQANLFKPFSQSNTRGTAGEKGTGLGLAIAGKIVTSHKGRILVDSTPGKGCTFTVQLPVAGGDTP